MIPLFPHTPPNSNRNQLSNPMNPTLFQSSSPSHKHIFNVRRLNPTNAHQGKSQSPKKRDPFTMDKKMINRLFLMRAHNTSAETLTQCH